MGNHCQTLPKRMVMSMLKSFNSRALLACVFIVQAHFIPFTACGRCWPLLVLFLCIWHAFLWLIVQCITMTKDFRFTGGPGGSYFPNCWWWQLQDWSPRYSHDSHVAARHQRWRWGYLRGWCLARCQCHHLGWCDYGHRQCACCWCSCHYVYAR